MPAKTGYYARKMKKINTMEMKHLIKIAEKIKRDSISNKGIRKITKQDLIMKKIKRKQLNWDEHWQNKKKIFRNRKTKKKEIDRPN